MISLNNTCKDCNKPLVGRSDKRFCNDYCRNSYHSKRNRNWNNYMRNINHILRKNRSILEGLYSQGYKTISSEKLVLLGFQFQYCTFIQQEKSLRVYYDFALNKQTNDTFKILCVASDDLLQTG